MADKSATSVIGRGETADVLDAVIVGAGFAGLYMLHRLRGLGLSTRVYEAGGGVGGTWFGTGIPARAAMWRACNILIRSVNRLSRNGSGLSATPLSRKSRDI